MKNYKGVSKDILYRRMVGSKKWADLARAMKVKALWKCERCGYVTQRLAVHHIRPIETARDLKEMEALCFDVNNLQVLCYSCHKLIHQQMKRSTKEQVQERARQRVERFMALYTNQDEDNETNNNDEEGNVETGE